MAADVEASVVTTPEVDEADWVPLQNTFSQNLVRRQQGEEEEAVSFSVTRGSSDSQVQVSFSGEGEEEGEGLQLSEEMSFDKLAALHRQMVELYPDDVKEDLLPELPTVPWGILSYLLSVEIRDTFYQELTEYLTTLTSLCSVDNVLAVFFADAFWSPAKYEEEWSDLNRRHLEDEKEVCLRAWDHLIAQRAQTEYKSMQQLHDFYEEEEDAEYHLEKAEEQLHEFQIKPFEDLGEIEQRRRDEASQRAKMAELSVTEQVKAIREEREHHEHYLEARESIHEMAIEKLQARAEKVEGMLQHMYEDRQHLGRKWDKKAQSRMHKLENRLNQIIVELLKTQVTRLSDQKDRALLDMAVVEEGQNMEEEVRAKEDLVYQIQLRLYEIQIRLLGEEEHKLRLQEKYAEGEALAAIKRRLEHIPSKQAKIRLKMQTCKEQLDHPTKRTINVEESYSAQFAAQKKEVLAKREEGRRKQLMKDQRQKTIQRVKQYMEKNPVPVKKIPPRYKKPPQKKKTPQKPSSQPPPSRLSAAVPLTKSMYSKKPSPAASKGGSKGNTRTAKKAGGAKAKSKASQSSGTTCNLPPDVPPPCQSIQIVTEAAQNLPPPPPVPAAAHPPPPPPPPPPTQAPTPPPPTQPIPKPTSPAKSRPGQKRDSAKPATNLMGGGINLNTILSARSRLKQTEFGKALGDGLNSTTDEIACLIRSGAKGDASLTKDAATFLRQRFEYITVATTLSDCESEPEDWD